MSERTVVALVPMRAQSERDGFFALGFVHAQDRLAQMLWFDRLARGRRLARPRGCRARGAGDWLFHRHRRVARQPVAGGKHRRTPDHSRRQQEWGYLSFHQGAPHILVGFAIG